MYSLKLLCCTACLWLPRVFSAAIVQHPLKADESCQSSNNDAALDKLKQDLGERLIPATPYARPCYEGGDAAECLNVHAFKTNDMWLTDQPGGYFYGQWASCQAEGQNCSLPVTTSAATPVSAICHQGSVPDLVVKLTSMETLEKDVKNVLEFVKVTGKPLVIRNTGHDWRGRSSGPGSIALWTHYLRHPSVPIILNENFTPDNCPDCEKEAVFHVGPGQTWGGLYDFAHTKGYTVVGGTCGTVGVAGWLHGGGHSPLTPNFGMGVDNVKQIEIITPEKGEKVVANEYTNQDLFFAVRGGGGGTWGLVTNITYRAVKDNFGVQAFNVDIKNFDDTLVEEYWNIIINNAVKWSQKGWGGYIKNIAGVKMQQFEIVNPNSNRTDAESDLEPLIKFLNRTNQVYRLEKVGRWYDYYVKHLKAVEAHPGASSMSVGSRLLGRDAFLQKDNREKLVKALMNAYTQDLTALLMLVTPSNYPHTTTSALHPSWKDAVLSARINDKWDQFRENSDRETNAAHYKKVYLAMKPIRELGPGMATSMPEVDIWEKDSHLLYWGEANHERLVGIKQKYDPLNLFTNFGAVNYNATDDRYRCYPKKPLSGLE